MFPNEIVQECNLTLPKWFILASYAILHKNSKQRHNIMSYGNDGQYICSSDINCSKDRHAFGSVRLHETPLGLAESILKWECVAHCQPLLKGMKLLALDSKMSPHL